MAELGRGLCEYRDTVCKHEDLSSIPGVHIKCQTGQYVPIIEALGKQNQEDPWFH